MIQGSPIRGSGVIFLIWNSFVLLESPPTQSLQSPQASASTLEVPHSLHEEQGGSFEAAPLGRGWGIILKYLVGRSLGFLLFC